MTTVPFIPSSAPFSAEQRAWLNGYFVGLLSAAHTTSDASTPVTEPTKSEPLLILFGSQTGTAEALARRIAKEAATHGYAAEARELNSASLAELASHPRLLIITSTWGDGEPPDNAAQFWSALNAPETPRLEFLHYSVLALGDRNYSDFCGAGRKFDERLQALGARRITDRLDCDVDYEPTANEWLARIWPALKGVSAVAIPQANGAQAHSGEPAANGKHVNGEQASSAPFWNRKNPFPARLITNRLLNYPGSSKETRHFEISLEDSGLTYAPGDALGVWAENCPELVSEIITTGGWAAQERVLVPDAQEMALVAALLRKCDLRKPSSKLLDALAKCPGCESFAELLTPDRKEDLANYLAHREILDLLIEFPAFRPSPAEFVTLLSKIQPRLYSISSSLTAFPGQVHITVGIVRYESLGRKRKGLCSSYLADRVPNGGALPIFIQSSHSFRLPADPFTPIIMVGPGTGIAPFRAFLHERQATSASGKNWLFFGDQHQATDFLYREEIETFHKDRLLTRLDLAFSRDQEEKIYVQQRMLEHAAELFAWLENGAHIYVCGDASRMAKDVDAALHQVIQKAGKSPDAAAEYVQNLKSQKRYQRDVY